MRLPALLLTSLVAAAAALPAASAGAAPLLAAPAFVDGTFTSYLHELADVNNDGFVDVVSQEFSTRDFYVSLGNGDGTFQAPFFAINGTSVTPDLEFADFNGDGKLDIVAADREGPGFTRWLGNGDGTFGIGTSTVVNTSAYTKLHPAGLAIVDTNRDGRADVVVTLACDPTESCKLPGESVEPPGKVFVYTGGGNGSFSKTNEISVTGGPTDVEVADLNLDGRDDLVVFRGGSPAGVTTILATSGGFGTPVDGHLSPRQYTNGSVGDVTGDGKPDLIVADWIAGGVLVAPGLGDGTFGPGILSPTNDASTPYETALGDFDGDGDVDIASVDYNFQPNTPQTVGVTLNDGDGNFGPLATQGAGGATYLGTIVSHDLDRDGRVDLLVDKSQVGTPGGYGVMRNTGGLPVSGSGQARITELRFRGQAAGDIADQYVQLYNVATTRPLHVGGWSLRFSNGKSVLIPQGTTIPPGGHLLFAGPSAPSIGYSFSGIADAATTFGLPYGTLGSFSVPQSNGGVALRSPTNNKVDAAGFGSVDFAYRVGTAITPVTPQGELSYVRKFSAGRPVATGDNAADFVAVDTGATGSTTAIFGSPRPDHLGAPTFRNDILQSSLVKDTVASSASPNRVLIPASGGNPAQLIVNRKLTNCSGQPLTGVCASAAPGTSPVSVRRLRFRVTQLSTIGNSTGAILKTRPNQTAVYDGITVRGTGVVDGPVTGQRGGLNSAWTSTALLPTHDGVHELQPGESVNVSLSFDVVQSGQYTFAYNTEDDLVPFTEQPADSGAAEPETPKVPAGDPVPEATAGTIPASIAPAVTSTLLAPPSVKPSLSSIVILPAAGKCRTSRSLKLRFKAPAGSGLKRVKVSVSGRKSLIVTGAKLSRATTLTKLPTGKYSVTIAVTLADGSVVSGRTKYRSCR